MIWPGAVGACPSDQLSAFIECMSILATVCAEQCLQAILFPMSYLTTPPTE